MEDKKDVIEVFESFADAQEISNSVTLEAKDMVEKLYGEKSNSRRTWVNSNLKKILIPSFACLVMLLIALPVVLTLIGNVEDAPKYYASNEMSAESIDNMSNFIIENAIDVCYYTDDVGMVANTANYVIETNELGYIKQKLIVMTEISFDIVELGIVVDNFDFEAFAEYAELDLSIEHLYIEISYKTERSEAQENIIYAHFNVDDVDYYLSITTISDISILNEYLSLLLN